MCMRMQNGISYTFIADPRDVVFLRGLTNQNASLICKFGDLVPFYIAEVT